MIGSGQVSFQLRSAAVLSVTVPGRAPYAIYVRKFRFPRQSRTDYTGAGYPALVSQSDPNDVEILWDEVPSVAVPAVGSDRQLAWHWPSRARRR